MAFGILAVVLLGFTPSFYLRGYVAPYAPVLPMSPLIVLHGVLFSAWVLYFIAQVSLISGRRVDLHRRLGVLGLLLAFAIVVVGALTGLHGVARHSGPPTVPPLSWLAVPLFDLPVFAGLVCAGWYHRRNAQAHKRLMLTATIGILAAPLGRLPYPALPTGMRDPLSLLLVLAPLAAWDIVTRGRLHAATWVGGTAVLISWPLRTAIWETAPWLAFAAWASSLVR
jgi:uncharacterized membrane protein YozB (DUF420 family)